MERIHIKNFNARGMRASTRAGAYAPPRRSASNQHRAVLARHGFIDTPREAEKNFHPAAARQKRAARKAALL